MSLSLVEFFFMSKGGPRHVPYWLSYELLVKSIQKIGATLINFLLNVANGKQYGVL
jgi:hypothetical protein